MFFRVSPWLILAVALGLRLYGLRYGLPAVYNPDEVSIMSRALAFAKGDLNPHNFLYPSFYFYVLFAWEGLTAIAAVAVRAVDSFGAFQREFFLDPTRVFVAGRLLTALLGTATVAATWALARRIAGPVAALTAAVVVAVSPLHVLNSHYVKHDVPVTLLIVLAYLAMRVPPRGGSVGKTPKGLIAASFITGMAFSTHYYAIFLAIPLAWSAARSSATRADAITRVALAAAISGAVFLLLSPFVLAEPGVALRDIAANRQIVVDRAVGSLGYGATLARYARMLVQDSVGWPFALVAAIGGIVLLRQQPRLAAWLLAFPIPFFFFIASTYPASRYLIPLVPFVAILAGVGIEWSARRSRASGWVGPLVFGALPLLSSIQTDRFVRQTDTRTLAREFIDAHVPRGATILIQPYSVPLEPTVEVLKEAVHRSGKPMPLKTQLQIGRTPYPGPAYRLIYIGRGLDVDKLYLPQEELGGADPLRLLRQEHVAFVVLKRYNDEAPALLPFLGALARQGRRIAVFAPYRTDAAVQPEPFLHNTDARISGELERPGPVVEIWQLDGPS